MADGMHAVVFVDNHDNQRGHGGGGGVLTASSKFEFKGLCSLIKNAPKKSCLKNSLSATYLQSPLRVLFLA